jgi:integrase
MKVYQDEDRAWRYAFRFNKKRYRVKTGLSKNESEKAMHAHWEKLRKAELGIETAAPVQSVSFEDFGKEFIEVYSKKKRRAKTTQSHENSIEHLKGHFGERSLSEITPEMIDRYVDARTGKVSSATINREVACLKTMMKMALRWGRIRVNPAAGIEKLSEPERPFRILSDDEISRLIASANTDLKRLLIIALNTGMRKNEILSLKWADVKFEGAYITVRAENSKSKRARNVPMNAAVLEAFRKLPKWSRVYVFMNEETGRQIRDFRTSFLGACKKAKIKGLRIHDLRHTAASKMIAAGVNIVVVSKILGHSDIKITMKYCHATPEDMQLGVDRLGAVLVKAIKGGQKVAISKSVSDARATLSASYMYN